MAIDDQTCHNQKIIANYFNSFLLHLDKLIKKFPLGKTIWLQLFITENFYTDFEREDFCLKHISEEFALMSKGSFMQTKHLCVLIHIWTKGEVGATSNRFKPSSKIF